MTEQRRFAGFELTHLLVLVTTIELAFNRLATPGLRPPGETPPLWHQVLDHVGLFSQYFASTLALVIIGRQLWRLARRRDLYWSLPRWGLIAAGALFLLSAALAVASNPGEQGSFLLESAFVVTLLFLALAQTTRRGDLAAKIGVALLALPLIIPYYGLLWLWLGQADDAFEMPERVRLLGQWSMVAVALLSPYFFAPRPFIRSAARLGPLVVAAFVGVVGVVILRQHYEVGMRLAHHGLGVDIGPGAPDRFLAVYLLALSTVTWTLTSCLGADAVARRDIGVGLALIVIGGYGFAWPFQYLVGMTGLMAISEAATRVVAQERSGTDLAEGGFRAPPITAGVWERYIRALVAALREGGAGEPAVDMAGSAENGDSGDDRRVTRIRAERRGVEVALRIEQHQGSITSVDIVCGREAPPGAQPAWTMYALPEGLLGIGAHPEPPGTTARVVKVADPPFAERFRIRDAGGYTERLFDEGLRARAIALIDGWMALWDGYGLRYHVQPGRGAPLDHPIPITELAFRGAGASPSPDRLVRLCDLLADVAGRILDGREEDAV